MVRHPAQPIGLVPTYRRCGHLVYMEESSQMLYNSSSSEIRPALFAKNSLQFFTTKLTKARLAACTNKQLYNT
jgi:hypothetical protein